MTDPLAAARDVGPEVLFVADPLVSVRRADIQQLKERAARNERGRMRLCAHMDAEDRLQEMLIVHTHRTYVRPHKHATKAESFHTIEGVGDLVVFEEGGQIAEIIELGDYASGRAFFYRLAEPLFHMLLVRSEFIVFHEASPGPYRRDDMVFPVWAPDGNDQETIESYLASIARTVEDRRRSGLDRHPHP